MAFLSPLVLLALPVVLGLVYWLYRRRRPPERKVAGLWLWQKARRQGRSRRQLDLRLWLLLFAASCMVLALARPQLRLERPGPLVIVLDASASMAATDLAPSRLESAKRQLRTRLASSPRALLIRAGERPQAFGPAPGRTLLDALAKIAPGDPEADLPAAIALGRRLLPGAPVLVASDSPDPGAEGYLNVGGNGQNVGITAIGPGFVAFANSGPGPWEGQVVVNGRPYALKIPAGGYATLEPPSLSVQAQVSANDALTLDNQASFNRRAVRVALSEAAPALERLLALLGTVRAPANPELRFEIGTPKETPPTFTVYFARQAQAEATVLDLERTLPYLRGVELVGFRLPVPPQAPQGWRPLLIGENGEILGWYNPNGVYLPPIAALRDLPAFPVLLYNLIAPRGEARQGLLRSQETLLPRPAPSRSLPPSFVLELSPWLALLAALLLAAEYLWFQRGSRATSARLPTVSV
ncbi:MULTISPECIES: VWA domain-containing protein [unclassified Meiothermus]|uniref:vWA domain-containing protein n=1 Tax=unclassified Meiothermus TaxID=370471 RepID=UPI000D7C72D2|nr:MULTISPECIES: VWA domain-containing protein [unclassified Meiothermus]PZA07922.1 VWA domain-containing protein [Meiothermus sp. Pnk-1]RYM36731.1 VWA domain-containing protein [Meiothermus sp. PNK-Is4]